MAKKIDYTINNEYFQRAVDIFFGSNIERPYSILAVFFMASKKYIRFETNIDLNSPFVFSYVKKEDVSSNWSLRWDDFGTESQALVVEEDVPTDEIKAIDTLFFYHTSDINQNIRFIDFILIQTTYNLLKLSDLWYKSNSAVAYEYILKRLQSKEKKNTDVFVQPKEITDLVINLLEADEGNLYNPYAGACSYAVNLKQEVTYYAQEINKITCAIGQLRLKLCNLSKASCFNEDSVSEWKGNVGYNFIIASPPFRTKVNSKFRESEFDFFVRSTFDTKHKAIGVYATHMLFLPNANREEYKSIIESDFIETVILLPDEVFADTSVPATIIIVNKKKFKKGYIRFIDATSKFIQGEKDRVKAVIPHLIEKSYHSLNSRGEDFIDIPLHEVISNGYNLNPQLYLSDVQNVPAGFKKHALSEYLTLVPKFPVSSQRYGYCLISILKTKGILQNSVVNSSDLMFTNEYKANICEVDKDCLIVNKHTLSTMYVIVDEKPFFFSQHFHAFSVNTSLISPQYIMDEMSKPYFKEQLKKYNRGVKLEPTLNETDILQLSIFVPESFEKQENIVLESERAKLVAAEKRLKAEFDSKMEDFIIGQRERKHAVAQVLNEIVPKVENISAYILSHDIVSKHDVVSSRFGTTLEEHLLKLQQRLDKVVDMVDNFTSQERFQEAEEIDLYQFLPDYCTSKNDNGRCLLVFDYEKQLDENQEYNKFLVSISRKDLTQILDNLFSNAMKYGFVDENRKDYQIQFKIIRSNDTPSSAMIKISNNGVPVSKNISIEKIFIWGEGAGSGIGCWQVKEIARHFGGDAFYKEFSDEIDGFVCEFTIVLPFIDEA